MDKITMWAITLAAALSVVTGVLYEDAKALGMTGRATEIGWVVWWWMCVPGGLLLWVHLKSRSVLRGRQET